MGVYYLSVDTDETGAGSASTPDLVTGFVQAVHVAYAADGEATTDVTVVASTPAETLATLANRNTAIVVRPCVGRTNTAGVGIVDTYGCIYLSAQRVTVTVAQGKASTAGCVTVRLVVSEDG